MKKVLIFTTRQLCYSSGAFFAARIGQALEELGAECEVCELEDSTNGQMNSNEIVLSERDSEKLEQYIGRSYDAIIDVNSKIPRMIMDDDSYYIDHIDAPFYNYIVDNPLYHHSTLSCQLKNYNVILLDQNHCEYVRRNYKHIKKCIFLPLGASEAVVKHSGSRIEQDLHGQKKQNDQKICDDQIEDVLFMGTYRNPEEYLNQIRMESDCSIRQCMLQMLEIMMEDTAYTMDMALQEVIRGGKGNIGDHIGGYIDGRHPVEGSTEGYTAFMNRMYPVEMYLRNYHRARVIDALVDGGIPVRVVGDWWDRYEKIDRTNLTWEKPVTFARSFDKIAEHSVLLDSSPFFKRGAHDRIFAGMANGAAVLTDGNSYKRMINERAAEVLGRIGEESYIKQNDGEAKGFGCGKVMELYSLDDMPGCVDKAAELLKNTAERRNMVENAYQEYRKYHTWEAVVKELVNQMRE